MAKNQKKAERKVLEERLLAHADELRAHIAVEIPARFRGGICVDDVLQETWVRVFFAISDFKSAEPDSFMRWCKSVANRKIVDAIRVAARRRGREAGRHDTDQRRESFEELFVELTAPGRTPSRDVAAGEAMDALRVVLSGLPEDRRVAIQLQHLEGRSRKEVAQQMGKSVPAVNSLLYHGLRQLRERLGDVAAYLSDDEFPRPRRSSARQELRSEVEIPAEAEEAEPEELIGEVVQQANAPHKAHGGSGLKIDEQKVRQDTGEKFRVLAESWRLERPPTSFASELAMHPAYQQIIGMGEKAVPLILDELEREPDHWFWALKAITGADPVPAESRGRLSEMAAAWLHWGRAQGYRR